MRAISSFNFEAGISTFWCRALIELRIRASMSATGSVNLIVCFSSAARSLHTPRRTCSGLLLNFLRSFEPSSSLRCHLPKTDDRLLPGRLRNPGDLTLQGQTAEAQAAYTELAQVRARPSADLAAVVLARGKLGLLCVFYSFCCCRHLAFSS